MQAIIKTSCGVALAALLTGCGSSEGGFTSANPSSTNIIWDFNFSIGFEKTKLDVLELPTGTLAGNPTIDFYGDLLNATPVNILGSYGQVSTKIIATAGDRLNAIVTKGTVHVYVQYGLIDKSTCTLTTTGQCSVTWTSITNLSYLTYQNGTPFTFATAGIGNVGYDLKNSVTIWVIGEETFFDTNGNGYFDDTEGFSDVDEPYVDINDNGIYEFGETIIDINLDGIHNTGDGFYNGTRCRHSTLCSPTTTTPLFFTSYIFLGFDGGGT